MKKPSPETVTIAPPSEQTGKLKDLGGSASDDFNNVLANQIANALWLDADPEERNRQFRATFAALIGIKPADEIEGMLAAQMAAPHNAALECFRRSMLREQTFEGRRENLNQANKLTRSYATLMEALNRHRGKGQQRVTVEHVHVHSGGQAIVGAVETGGGVLSENQRQPHAKALEHAQQPTLRSQDPQREPVPCPGDAERTVSDARGSLAGRTQG
jgi:hypothetical protein